jgi:ribosomal protein S1
MSIEENTEWVDSQWERLKQELPIGHKLYGHVVRIEPFGVFLDIGYKIIDGYKLSGLIDIGTKSDHDSSGLPMDYSLWPKIGEKVYCKVVWLRDSNKELSLSIVN